MWMFLQKISVSAFEALEETPPVVPTRPEISENIRVRKEKTGDDAPSMMRAFQTHINGMCKQLSQTQVLDNADEVVIKKWMARWHEFAKGTSEGKKNSLLCQQQDPTVLPSLGPSIREAR